jgi:hypothetical protein
MYYPDLTNYEYSPPPLPNVLNIGWLEHPFQFPQGNIDEHLIKKLTQVTRVNYWSGKHSCQFCKDMAPADRAMGTGELWIQGEGNIIYVAPSLIVHYMRDHDYCPPEEFIHAVEMIRTDYHLNVKRIMQKRGKQSHEQGLVRLDQSPFLLEKFSHHVSHFQQVLVTKPENHRAKLWHDAAQLVKEMIKTGKYSHQTIEQCFKILQPIANPDLQHTFEDGNYNEQMMLTDLFWHMNKQWC